MQKSARQNRFLRFSPAHPILDRICRAYDLAAAAIQGYEAAEKPNGFGTAAFTIASTDGPVQVLPYNPRRRRVALVNTGADNAILLNGRNSAVERGFTIAVGMKTFFKCKGAIWISVKTGSTTIEARETFDREVLGFELSGIGMN